MLTRRLFVAALFTAAAGCASRPHTAGGPPTLSVTTHASSEGNGSVNSYLLTGRDAALLIDTQLVLSETAVLIETIRASGKKLETIWITHAHPDHFMGIAQLTEAFPEANVLARPDVAEQMPELFDRFEKPLNKFFPGDVAASVPSPVAYDGDTLELEGVEIRILDFEGGESESTTALMVPSLQALFCADMVYNHVHPWLNELRIEGVLDHVEQVRSLDGVETIYPGHGAPMSKADLDGYVQYVETFVDEVEAAPNSDGLIETMLAHYPDYKTQAGLRFSAGAHIAARDGQP